MPTVTKSAMWCLQQMTLEVENTLRHSDVFCRYRGEEFSIVAPQTAAEAALLLANRIRESVAVAPLEPIRRPVTISLGMASLTPTLIDPQELVSAADAALYTAKAERRNHACLFHPSVPDGARRLNDADRRTSIRFH